MTDPGFLTMRKTQPVPYQLLNIFVDCQYFCWLVAYENIILK